MCIYDLFRKKFEGQEGIRTGKKNRPNPALRAELRLLRIKGKIK